MPRVYAEQCSGCGLCVEVCPYLLLELRVDGTAFLQDDWQSRCLNCGHCSAVCPQGAVRMDGRGTWEPAPGPPSAEDALGWLRQRRSVRRYRPQSVSRELVGQVLEAARCAPTGHNARELGCVVVCTAERRERLAADICAVYRRFGRALGNPVLRALVALWAGPGRVRELRAALPGLRWAEEQTRQGHDPLFHHAPVILLLHAPPSETAEADCALAAGQLSLLAPSLGLGTCHIGYASALLKRFPWMARRYAVPRGHRVFSVLTLGYPAVVWLRTPPRPELQRTWC